MHQGTIYPYVIHYVKAMKDIRQAKISCRQRRNKSRIIDVVLYAFPTHGRHTRVFQESPVLIPTIGKKFD